MYITILFIYFNFYIGFCFGAPQWPSEYFVEGENIDLIEHRVVPFKLWINTENDQIRTEAYDGLIRFQMDANISLYTYVYHYVSDREGNSKLLCSEVDNMGGTLPSLPDLDYFELTGKEIHDGKRIQVWTRTYDGKKARFEETMYVYRKKPVKYTYRCFDKQNGQLTTDYVIKYFGYSKKVDANVFKFDNKPCKHIYDNYDIDESVKSHNPEDPVHVEVAFLKYKKLHNKKYDKDEHESRKRVFRENWKLINEHNKKNLGYKMTLNKFADRFPKEMSQLNAVRPHKPSPGTHQFPYNEAELEEIVKEIPEEFDWRTKGVVSGIKSQSSCGSCWAFATTAIIESALAVKYGTVFDLSKQSLVDCSWDYNDHGCYGGFCDRAMNYVIDHGIPTEEDYGGYLAMDGKCHISNMTRTYQVRGYVAVTPMSVNALKAALYKHGPVSAHGREPDQINHAVVVVGYGVRDGDLFWIVKNSYGQEWGEDGYILISAKDNIGNILFAPYYPLV